MTFLTVLKLFKIVSLSSMVSSVAAAVYIWLAGSPMPVNLVMVGFVLLIVIRHRENIRRMIRGTENKIHWM